MPTTAYDYRLRTIECPSCGAPLVAPQGGGQVTCQYCSTTSVVTAREVAPRAGVRSSLAEETARLSRLMAQLEHPVAGHPYDLTRPPLGYETWAPEHGAEVHRLLGEWTAALRVPPGAGAESQRRVCWMALQAVSAPAALDALRTRALLETTLGWLQDEGYRHLVRCRLSRAALDDGDIAAAQGWLEECDLAPEVLELDSALRLTRAWIACRGQRYPEVLELCGHGGVQLPVALHAQNELQRLGVDTLERIGQRDAAVQAFEALERKNGLDAEVSWFTRQQLAPATLAAIREIRRRQHEAYEATQQENRERSRINKVEHDLKRAAKRRQRHTVRTATIPLRWLPVGALLFSAFVLTVRCSADEDLLGGVYGHVLCPRVCPTCEGPTRTVTAWSSTRAGEWTSNGPEYFCHAPGNGLRKMSSEQLESNRWKLNQYKLGGFSAFAASYLILLVLLIPVAIALSIRRALINRGQRAAIDIELEGLAASIGQQPPPPPPSVLLGTVRDTVASLVGSGLLAAVLAWLLA